MDVDSISQADGNFCTQKLTVAAVMADISLRDSIFSYLLERWEELCDFLNMRSLNREWRLSTIDFSATRDVRGRCQWCLTYHASAHNGLCSWCRHMSQLGAKAAWQAYRLYIQADVARAMSNRTTAFRVHRRIGPFRDGIISEATLPYLERAGISIEDQVASRSTSISIDEVGDDPVAFYEARYASRAFITAADAHTIYVFKHCEHYNYQHAPWLMAIFGLVVDPWNVQTYPSVDFVFRTGNCFKMLDVACKGNVPWLPPERGCIEVREKILNFEPSISLRALREQWQQDDAERKQYQHFSAVIRRREIGEVGA
eukprot:TRINITY_DN40767_c0_g1_i1.p1 TRINITY_DN40767_c0_g1~~TRINITY_DN40767_c0_g1_i1.p1  ORF type:complete len:314 (+),score=21.21 TRINITY_DN40767_c0_g1_i1:79-1020(+)